MICSWCYQDKNTVNRELFDGLCAECTDLAINNEHIAKHAKKYNKLLKMGMKPTHECPCESTRQLINCDNLDNCDGSYIWTRDGEK
jgi:hypothetical protein